MIHTVLYNWKDSEHAGGRHQVRHRQGAAGAAIRPRRRRCSPLTVPVVFPAANKLLSAPAIAVQEWKSLLAKCAQGYTVGQALGRSAVSLEHIKPSVTAAAGGTGSAAALPVSSHKQLSRTVASSTNPEKPIDALLSTQLSMAQPRSTVWACTSGKARRELSRGRAQPTIDSEPFCFPASAVHATLIPPHSKLQVLVFTTSP